MSIGLIQHEIIKSFNKNRDDGLWPESVLCADESVGAWQGHAAKLSYITVGLPHVPKIARKPEEDGTEYRSLCCAETKLMLQLECTKVRKNERKGTLMRFWHIFSVLPGKALEWISSRCCG